MSTRKSTVEKIEETKVKITQYENRMKQLQQKQKEQDRKARTKRLIERGAIAESLIPGADALTNEQIKAFLARTVQTEYARKILAGLKTQGGEAAVPKPAATAQGNNVGEPQDEGKSAEQAN